MIHTHTIRMELLEHNFFHVKNQWILVGKGSHDIDRQLASIAQKAHQKFHWFLDNADVHMNAFNITALRNAAVAGDFKMEVFIHVPKYAKDEMTKVKEWFSDEPELRLYTTFLCEKHGTCFAISEGHDRNLSIIFNNDVHMIESKIWLGASWDYITNLNDYVVPKSDNKAREPSKETQIARFKSNTPMCILKGFKDEEDIWHYIQEEDYFHNMPPKRITIKVGTANEAAGAMDVIAGTIADTFHVPMELLKVEQANKNGRIYHLSKEKVDGMNQQQEGEPNA